MTLSEWMKERSWTDEAMAEAVDVSRPYITKLRNGKRTPSIRVALAIEELTKGRVAPSSFNRGRAAQAQVCA